MGKDQQPQPQPYPVQVPLAPPSYDDAMKNIQTNVPYASAPSAGFIPPQPFAGGTYVQQPPVIEVQRTIIALPLGPTPARITCPRCNAEIITSTETEPSCAAHLCCLVLLIIGCCPLSSLPYCMDSLKNVRHTCPNCNMFLGSYQP
ncbi:hypothetical protein PGB90_010323 [Kerria lacca]